jgi:hypothetical protein
VEGGLSSSRWRGREARLSNAHMTTTARAGPKRRQALRRSLLLEQVKSLIRQRPRTGLSGSVSRHLPLSKHAFTFSVTANIH